MTRKFKTVDYEAALEQTISLREALPASHLARFIVDVVAELNLALIYERYGPTGGEAYAPEVLLALLFYGYATGVFSSRKIEKAARCPAGHRVLYSCSVETWGSEATRHPRNSWFLQNMSSVR